MDSPGFWDHCVSGPAITSGDAELIEPIATGDKQQHREAISTSGRVTMAGFCFVSLCTSLSDRWMREFRRSSAIDAASAAVVAIFIGGLGLGGIIIGRRR